MLFLSLLCDVLNKSGIKGPMHLILDQKPGNFTRLMIQRLLERHLMFIDVYFDFSVLNWAP